MITVRHAEDCAERVSGYRFGNDHNGQMARNALRWTAGAGVVSACGVAVRSLGYHRRRRGLGWHWGHKCDERFMNGSRRIGVPHLLQGSPARP